jgi:hypothetical protein
MVGLQENRMGLDIDDLTLQEVVGEEAMPADAFKKDADGKWRCLKACTIEIERKQIVFPAGLEFEMGVPYLGIDVAKWLNENYSAQQRM